MNGSNGPINVREEKKGEVIILRFKGKLDSISAPDVEKKIFDLINRGEHKMLLDFSEITYVSSAGMRVLFSTAKKLKGLSGQLRISSVAVNVMDDLKLSGFDQTLELFNSEEDALRLF